MTSRESFSDEVPTTGSRPRVVVVADQDDLRRRIAATLRKDGYDIIERRSARDALELFGERVRAPDAVVGGGAELLAWLRERGWATPMIVTGRADGGVYAPDAALDEPLDVERLRTILLDLLWPRKTLPSI